MKSYKADLVRLFILMNLLVLALFTIPAHGHRHDTVNRADQHQNENVVSVTDANNLSQVRVSF